MIRSLFLWILRLGLAGLYLFAAVPKIIDPWSFARSIMNFRILPLSMIPPIAVWLPFLEGIAALAVASGLLIRGGAFILTLLSGAFAAGIASAILRGLDIDCGCFGASAGSRANLGHLVLNASALAAGIILLAAHGRRRRKRPKRS